MKEWQVQRSWGRRSRYIWGIERRHRIKIQTPCLGEIGLWGRKRSVDFKPWRVSSRRVTWYELNSKTNSRWLLWMQVTRHSGVWAGVVAVGLEKCTELQRTWVQWVLCGQSVEVEVSQWLAWWPWQDHCGESLGFPSGTCWAGDVPEAPGVYQMCTCLKGEVHIFQELLEQQCCGADFVTLALILKICFYRIIIVCIYVPVTHTDDILQSDTVRKYK